MPTTLIQQAEDIQINDQNEVDQILGHPPSWILYWGVSLVFVATFLFIALAWLIKYPDVIDAKVQILTENPAIRLVPLVSGKIEELLIQNYQAVQKGDLLAVIESPVKRSDIIQLENVLAHIAIIEDETDYIHLNLLEDLQLGTMQNQYANLVQKVKDYQYYLRKNNAYQKIRTLKKQIKHTINLNNNIKKQQGIIDQEVAIARKNYKRNEQLNKDRVVSDVDLEQLETTYLQYQRQLYNFQTQIINNQIQIDQLHTQIQDLQQNQSDGNNTKALKIKESSQNLQGQIEIWKQTYLIFAPITGKVNLSKVFSLNQFTQAGEKLFTIVPLEGTGKIIARALIPIENSGKVKRGQEVNIYLDGFPYQEYGIIKSDVAQIDLVPQKEYYMVDLSLPNTLLTTYDKQIPFKQEMQGTAKIITEERRILQRIFDRLYSIIKNT